MEQLEVRTLLSGTPLEFTNPHPVTGGQFGSSVTVLANGNVVVVAANDDAGGGNAAQPLSLEGTGGAGAVYLFDGTTGNLISTLTGSHPGDFFRATVTALANGHFVIAAPFWDNDSAVDAGAVTWGNGLTGVTGTVSAANSLVGSTMYDRVGFNYELNRTTVTALTNGNYVVSSPTWDNGSVNSAGAVTWGNGLTGVTGTISAANSLVGSSDHNEVGEGGVTTLTNGNYVVSSPYWDNGSAEDAGAVTWGNGLTGVTGTVSAANSLVGSTYKDYLGGGGVTTLTNGNYVVSSPYWANGSAWNAGAVTWGNGLTGVTGTINAANSLVGSKYKDFLSGGGVTALTNGNYVVSSPGWDNGSVDYVGAVTWGNGLTGVTGSVNAANSLVGSQYNDSVGGVTPLTNGNYVVNSPKWKSYSGAVTWGNGLTGVTGRISEANSLVGAMGDNVGWDGVTALTNGNYVVSSRYWDNGAEVDTGIGAVTWGNGLTGVTGPVNAANSLVGSATGDFVGRDGVTALTNGNYVVRSHSWHNGSSKDAGAVTWGNGLTGVTGPVDAANSLVGSTNSDYVGLGGVTVLVNGNYVINSPDWNNGSAEDAGAVTWGNGLTGVTGTINAANSLVGSTNSDYVGLGGVTVLTNGNYVINSPLWDNGSAEDAGAAIWGNGLTGVTGTINAANSLVGSTNSDYVSFDYQNFRSTVMALTNGNYVVSSPDWDNGSVVNAGAVTWGNGLAGVTGTIDASNSFLGQTPISSNSIQVVEDRSRNRFYAAFPYAAAGHVYWGSTSIGFSPNEAPTDLSLSNSSIAENNTANATVGTFLTTDPDTGDTCTYSLVTGAGSTDNDSFSISGNALMINASANFEAQDSYSIRVRSTDAGGLSVEKTFSITVTNVNSEPPTDIGLSNSSIAENNTANATVGIFSTTDPDTDDTFTYNLVTGAGSADNDSFSISGNALMINASANFEAQDSYSIRVRSTDAGGLSVEKTFSITVTNANNDAPTITLANGPQAGRLKRSVIIDPLAQLTDPDSADFSRTSIRVNISQGKQSSDVIGVLSKIRSTAGLLKVKNGAILQGKKILAQVSVGTGGQDLVITFGDGVSQPVAQEILRNVTFTSRSSGQRTISIQAIDSTNATSTPATRDMEIQFSANDRG